MSLNIVPVLVRDLNMGWTKCTNFLVQGSDQKLFIKMTAWLDQKYSRRSFRFYSMAFFFGFFLYVLYSTLLHLPPLRFHYVGGCRGPNPGLLRLRRRQSDALTTRLDLIHISFVVLGRGEGGGRHPRHCWIHPSRPCHEDKADGN